MQDVIHRFWHTSVRRQGELLLASTSYFDQERELEARLTVGCSDLVIREGSLEQHRPVSSDTLEVQAVPGLHGIRAHIGSGRELQHALKEIQDNTGASLFAETVRGIIQAETYLYRERGFSSLEEYSQYWDRFYAGGCRYYINRNRVECSWSDYAGKSERTVNLFNRFKSQHLYMLNSGNYFLTGTLNDSFHEMSIHLYIDKSNNSVLSAAGHMLRIPDQICRESLDYLENLHGQNISLMPKKEIATLLGKEQGCVHLIDIAHDTAETLSSKV